MANDAFTVYIYANEYEYLKWLVLQKQDIETGGDLFGVWQNELCAVVQFVLGPGKQCRRTTTSFFQDVSYLANVGRYMTSNEGICNIGEWHSHHRIGLAHPSGGDENTVWGHMGTVSGGRFLVFIANIQGRDSVNVGCFMFNSATGKMTQGKMEAVLESCSPIRHTFVQGGQFKLEAELDQDWNTFCMSKSSKRWRGSKVGVIESGVRHCACDTTNTIGCCVCLEIVLSCVCWCLRAMSSAISRCGSWALRSCLSGLFHLYRKCCGRPARD